MASRVAHGLNHRFQQGTPSGSIDRAGVVVRGFDKSLVGEHTLGSGHTKVLSAQTLGDKAKTFETKMN